MEEGEFPTEAQFNQASFQQSRINELLLRIDRLSINLLEVNDEFSNSYNYEIVFNDLKSVYFTISAKLPSEEKTEVKDIIKFIHENIEARPVWTFRIQQGMEGSRTKQFFNKKNWNVLRDSIYDFRILLERLMDIHGYGNPTKSDPRARFGK